jgi:hypothetical protein
MVAEHGYSKYTNDGCRCQVCAESNREVNARRRAKRAAWVGAHGLPENVAHGASAYQNWGCRCQVCAADARALRARRRRRGAVRAEP